MVEDLICPQSSRQEEEEGDFALSPLAFVRFPEQPLHLMLLYKENPPPSYLSIHH